MRKLAWVGGSTGPEPCAHDFGQTATPGYLHSNAVLPQPSRSLYDALDECLMHGIRCSGSLAMKLHFPLVP